MANNGLTVAIVGGGTKTLRSTDVGSDVQSQNILVNAGLLSTVVTTGGTVQYTIDNSPAIALDPPTATALYCRFRVYEQTQDPTLRLYYRTDGTTVTSSNATGFLLHGELLELQLATFTNVTFIAEGAGVFTGYAEWLTVPGS